VLVAERAGAVIGTVTVAPAGTPWANVARPGELEVRMLAVHGEARRQGVAEALMAAAEDHARTRGLGTVVLSTDALYREEFADDVGPQLRQALAVRCVYRTARRRAST